LLKVWAVQLRLLSLVVLALRLPRPPAVRVALR
jgi:hypothetical protein